MSFSQYLWFVVNLNSVNVLCLIGVNFGGTNVLVLSSIEAVKRKPWETSQHTQTSHTAAVMACQLTSRLAGNQSLLKKTVTSFSHNLLPVLAQNCSNTRYGNTYLNMDVAIESKVADTKGSTATTHFPF